MSDMKVEPTDAMVDAGVKALFEALPDDTLGSVLRDLRYEGWAVAVHNDYRLNGEEHTFWLLTHSNGRFVKGEGRTDVEALAQCRAQISEAETNANLLARLNATPTTTGEAGEAMIEIEEAIHIIRSTKSASDTLPSLRMALVLQFEAFERALTATTPPEQGA